MSRENRIYVGNLPPDIRTRDIEDIFYKYGKITMVDLKNQKGPPFAFVEFEDPRDASDSIRYRNGYDYDGYVLRVEFPRGGGSRDYDGGGGYGGGGRGGFRGRGGYGGGGRGGGGRFGPPSRRTNYRVLVSGLPPSGSWQDLKDHMREAGDVCYADVFKDGTGVVEFQRRDDMRYAVKKLDDTKFRSHEGEHAYVRVKEDTTASSRSRSRSLSPAGAKAGGRGSRASPRYSPMRNRDRSYSRSPR